MSSCAEEDVAEDPFESSGNASGLMTDEECKGEEDLMVDSNLGEKENEDKEKSMLLVAEEIQVGPMTNKRSKS